MEGAMSLNTQLSNTTVNAQGDALATLLNNGYCRIYSGTQPTDANTDLGSQTLLAELRFQATAAPSTVGGVVTFNSLTSGTAVATGTASFFRCFKSDGTTVVMDGSVGTSSANMVLGTTSIVSGATVSTTSFTHTVAKSASGY
jgi:hypothetical protein